jgi:hypothetical protein
VKFAKREEDTFVFEIGIRERDVLAELLELYPAIPASHHRITRDGGSFADDEHQKLLEQALAEHRQQNKAQLQALLTEEGRFQSTPSGYHLFLSRAQVEWLLQVINDIRVGSWLILGSPDEMKGRPVELTEGNARYLWAMELCSYLEALLLDALEQ